MSGATSQWRKTDWESQGEISNCPKGKLVFVFRQADGIMQHEGVQLPDGSCVHAKGHNYGVVHDRPGVYPWTHYAVPKGMEDAEKNTQPDFSKPVEVVAGMKAEITAKTGSTVNIRKAPNGELLTSVQVGSEAKVLSSSGAWSKVRVEVDGWVKSEFLKKKE